MELYSFGHDLFVPGTYHPRNRSFLNINVLFARPIYDFLILEHNLIEVLIVSLIDGRFLRLYLTKVLSHNSVLINFSNNLIYLDELVEPIEFLQALQKLADITRILNLQQLVPDMRHNSKSIVDQGYASKLYHQVPDILDGIEGEAIDVVGDEPLENPHRFV